MDFLSVLNGIVSMFLNRKASKFRIVIRINNSDPRLTTFTVYTAFKQFGAIKNIGFLKYNQDEYVIEFLESHSADAALLKHRITIEWTPKLATCSFQAEMLIAPCNVLGFRYCWTEVDKKVNVNKKLLRAPSKNSSKNILNILNDDCLREIFKKLPLSSHSSITNVCVRFNQVAKEYFPLKHKHIVFIVNALKEWTLSEADIYIQNFGLSIYKVEWTGENLKREAQWKMNAVLGMISEYCKNIAELVGRNSSLLYVNDVLPLFMQLEKLYIENLISGVDLEQIFRLSFQLKILRVKMTESCRTPQLYPIKLPKLVAFSFECENYIDRYPFYHKSLVQFLSQNCQLEMFSYSNANCYLIIGIAVELISELKCLKVLRVKCPGYCCYYRSIKPLVQELSLKNIPIECLRLEIAFVDGDVIEHISKMRNIRKLEFRYIFYNDNNARTIEDSNSNDCVQEKYLICLLHSLPNLEAIMMRSFNRMEIILSDGNIYQMEKELQKKIPSAELHIKHLINSENAFIDEYKYCTNAEKFDTVTATIKKFTDIGQNTRYYWLIIEGECCGSWEFDIFLSPYLTLIDR